MPTGRRPSKHARPHRPLSGHHPVAQERRDGRWVVRGIPAGRSEKAYRCPGCDQVILPGVAHVVVWPAEGSLLSRSGLEERRHWHRSCWQRRG
ncbi:hypothetical protein GCM10027418_13870 [Mariniluteicoccus endophyticus]